MIACFWFFIFACLNFFLFNGQTLPIYCEGNGKINMFMPPSWKLYFSYSVIIKSPDRKMSEILQVISSEKT